MLATFFILSSITGIGTAAEVFVQEGSSIQEAVNNAVPGDVIIVKPGTYTENVHVTKNDLVIISESGSPADTVVKAYDPNTDVFSIEADNITVKGFTVTGAEANSSGICLSWCNNCLIDSNKLFNNFQGIYLKSSLRNRVLNNIVFKGDRGISADGSDYNLVSKNLVFQCGYGIYFLNSKDNRISKNTAKENRGYGILIMGSNNNILSENTASGNKEGIHFASSDGNTLSNSTISSNEVYGLFVCPRSDFNLIYNNYFNNTFNIEANNGTADAYSKSKTKGENIAGGPYIGGNYWATPNGTGFSETAVDTDGDGFADNVYKFETSHYTDPLPLIAYKSMEPIPPIANLSINTPEGYPQLSVQFTDLSENETSRSWDFENNGVIDSSDEAPVYTYPAPGTYIVNLTVSNEDGTDTKTVMIDVGKNNVTDIQAGSKSGEENTDTTGSQAEQSSGQGGIIRSIPGFEIIYGVFSLLAIYVSKVNRK